VQSLTSQQGSRQVVIVNAALDTDCSCDALQAAERGERFVPRPGTARRRDVVEASAQDQGNVALLANNRSA